MRTIISDSENENNLTLGSDYRLSMKGALRPWNITGNIGNLPSVSPVTVNTFEFAVTNWRGRLRKHWMKTVLFRQ